MYSDNSINRSVQPSSNNNGFTNTSPLGPPIREQWDAYSSTYNHLSYGSVSVFNGVFSNSGNNEDRLF